MSCSLLSDSDALRAIPPPELGDVLFGPDSQVFTSACVGANGGEEFYFPEGYRRAARLLAIHACANEQDLDLLVWPICYLYRHHIELMLKRLVRRAGLLQGVDLRPEGHVLKTLWDKLKPLWSEVFRKRFKQELSQNEIGGIDGYICQLDDLDQGGDTFRYPLKRQKQGGGSTLKAGIELIGVERVALAMERLSEELARWDEVLDELSVA